MPCLKKHCIFATDLTTVTTNTRDKPFYYITSFSFRIKKPCDLRSLSTYVVKWTVVPTSYIGLQFNTGLDSAVK